MTEGRRPAGPFRVRPAGIALLPLVLLIALIVGACGSPAGSTTAPESPQAVPSPSVDDGGPAPSATPWPGGVVEAVVILGKADAEIKAAGADLGAAAAYEDLDAMRGAADGLATLIERLQRQVPRIAEYPETAAAASAYAAAFPGMLAGATALRDAITAGDATGITEGSRQLAAGLQQYEEARRLIGPLVDRAILMQRLLTK